MIWIFCTARSGSTWLRSMLHELVEGGVWEEPKVGRFGAAIAPGEDPGIGPDAREEDDQDRTDQ
jgi:hypothetical protein